jgi:hypothetical protein
VFKCAKIEIPIFGFRSYQDMMLENQKHIDAPQSIVWSVTENIQRWPQWTPTVENVKRLDDEPFGVGSTALIKQPGLPEAEWRVTELTKGEGFTWEARILGIRTVATHELAPVGTGTRSILRIEMFGIAAALLWPLIRASAQKSLEQENAGLKAECEALATSR